jgi:DNA repair exonuclease SbcCD ATPase subunit
MSKQQLQVTQQASNTQVLAMQREMSAMKKSIEDVTATISSQIEDYEQLKLRFERRTGVYNSIKKDLVAKKNCKLHLQDSIRNIKATLQQLNIFQVDFRKKLKTVQSSSMEQLKGNMNQLEQQEHDIYAADSKLTMITQENARFTQSISELEKELEYIERQKQCNEQLWRQLIDELDDCRRKLVKEWMNEENIHQDVTVRDGVTLTRLDELRVDTNGRQLVVCGVSDRLESELNRLAEFLDNIAHRRPSSNPSQHTKPVQT